MASSSFAIRQERKVFNTKRRAAFYADMANFLDADIPPFQALTRMELAARRRRGTRRIANIYGRIRRAMDTGRSMADALAREVPGNEAVMLVGADKAGPVVVRKALREMSQLLDRQQTVKEQLAKALVLNGLSIGTIVGVLVMVMMIVVPQLQKAVTPKMAAYLGFAPKFFAFGNGLMEYGIFVLVALGLLGYAIVWSLPRWRRNQRWWSRSWFDQHMLPWTLYVRTQATFFLATVASMMRAGIPLQTVLSDLRPFASPWMSHHLRHMLGGLAKGKQEVDVMDTPMLPQDTRDRLRVYSLMRDFTGVMSRLSRDNFETYEKSIERLNALLRLLSVVLMVVFIASLLFAIFDFTQAITEANRLSNNFH